MEVYGNGFHFADKDEIDKKINVDGPIFGRVTNNTSIPNIIGTMPHIGMRLLKVFRDDTVSGKTAGNNGSGIAFGGGDTVAIISVDGWGNHIVQVSWCNGEPDRFWQEQIAWKSDIDALKARISALEKQIGGTK